MIYEPSIETVRYILETGAELVKKNHANTLTVDYEEYLRDIKIDQWYLRRDINGIYNIIYHCMDGLIHYPFSNDGSKTYFVYAKDYSLEFSQELRNKIREEFPEYNVHYGKSVNWADRERKRVCRIIL